MEIYHINKIQAFKGIHIDCMTAYANVLLASGKYKELSRCTLTNDKHAGKPIWRLETKLKFSRKPVIQMKAIPELSLLLHIEDELVVVHDLKMLAPKTVVQGSQGATVFATDLREKEMPGSGENKQQYSLRMCVSSGRKLQLYDWKDDDFELFENELNLSKHLKAVMWCGDAVCVGFSDEYFMIKPETGDIKELFTVGSSQKIPLITKIPNNQLLLGYDNKSVFIDARGNPSKDYPIMWSNVPGAVVQDSGYLLALMKGRVEIRSIAPAQLIQHIDVKHARILCQSSGRIFAASNTAVWCLEARTTYDQVRILVAHDHYELAVHVAELSETSSDQQPTSSHMSLVLSIKNRLAVHKFVRQDYVNSMEIFKSLDTDPIHVIGLVPSLLPSKLRDHVKYPEKIPPIEGVDFERALLSLIGYLREKKREFQRSDEFPVLTPIMPQETDVTLKTRDQLFSVIDTTLLKCYLKTNDDTQIAPLLRDPGCMVPLHEAEKALSKAEKYSELVILYQTKKEHEKALDLLRKLASRHGSLHGPGRTVQYLNQLGSDYLGLIFKYAHWVLKSSKEEGLLIFTAEIPEVKALPRGHVLSFLVKDSPDVEILYLEHVIHVWNDTTEELHNRLIDMLRRKTQELANESHAKIEKDSKWYTSLKMDTDDGRVKEYRAKLLHQVETSEYYDADEVLHKFPLDEFFEVRAILLGRLGRHDQALGIYVYILRDDRKAEDHCNKHYTKEPNPDLEVFGCLLKTYVSPPEPQVLGIHEFESPVKPNLSAAIRVLAENAARIDIKQALEILPENTKLKDVHLYLEAALHSRLCRRLQDMVRKCMQYNAYLQSCEERIELSRTQFEIREDDNCTVCNRRIGTSSFARYPHGLVVHYGCWKDGTRVPVGRLPSGDFDDLITE